MKKLWLLLSVISILFFGTANAKDEILPSNDPRWVCSYVDTRIQGDPIPFPYTFYFCYINQGNGLLRVGVSRLASDNHVLDGNLTPRYAITVHLADSGAQLVNTAMTNAIMQFDLRQHRNQSIFITLSGQGMWVNTSSGLRIPPIEIRPAILSTKL